MLDCQLAWVGDESAMVWTQMTAAIARCEVISASALRPRRDEPTVACHAFDGRAEPGDHRSY